MNEIYTIKAEKRFEFGKNASRRYRKQGKIPANILEKGRSIPVLVRENDFVKLLNLGLLPSMKILVELEGEKFEVLPKEIQRDTITNRVIHIDLYKMTPGHKFHLHVPIELKGTAKGMKSGGALEQYIQMLRIRSAPEYILQKIEIDITNLDVGQGIRLSQLNLPKEWDILNQGDPLICRIAHVRTGEKSQESSS